MRPTVLLIDDDVAGVSIRAQLLRVHGYEPMVAYTGAQGLTLADDHAVDLVVLDLSLPDMPGTEVLLTLRQRQPFLPVVVLSALLEVDDTVEQNAAAVLVKGSGARVLLDTIAEQLEGAHE